MEKQQRPQEVWDMEKYEGKVPDRANRGTQFNQDVWKILQDGPIQLKVGEDFPDLARAQSYRTQLSGNVINRLARNEGKRVRTWFPDKETLVIWLEERERGE
jgi:hypothetical protein